MSQGCQQRDQLADQQDKAEKEDEGEDSEFSIVIQARRVPAVKELSQWSEKCCHYQQNKSELKQTPHLFIIQC
jgi:hypothetical protein